MKRRKSFAYHYDVATLEALSHERHQAWQAAEERFEAITTALMRKMPVDHAALKAAIRQLRAEHLTALHARADYSAIREVQAASLNRLGVRLGDLVQYLRAVEYRYYSARRDDRRYVEFAMNFVAAQVSQAVLVLHGL